jgi:sugar lactone lactonase YvrE
VVVGPDGLLYVSSDPNPGGTGGQVLRFDPNTLAFEDVFIDEPGGPGQLNRPEGLVFGPDGNLYITSFRATTGDTDSIRVYHATGVQGVLFDRIELDKVGQGRAFAQALLFGKGGYLFVPISNSGEIRKYDVGTHNFDVFVPAGTLGAPFYLTFGRTDPGTLAYPDE